MTEYVLVTTFAGMNESHQKPCRRRKDALKIILIDLAFLHTNYSLLQLEEKKKKDLLTLLATAPSAANDLIQKIIKGESETLTMKVGTITYLWEIQKSSELKSILA